MAIRFSPNRRAGWFKGSLDCVVDNQKTSFLVCFGSRDYLFGIGYGSRCLRLLQLEQGLYGGWNRDWFIAD